MVNFVPIFHSLGKLCGLFPFSGRAFRVTGGRFLGRWSRLDGQDGPADPETQSQDSQETDNDRNSQSPITPDRTPPQKNDGYDEDGRAKETTPKTRSITHSFCSFLILSPFPSLLIFFREGLAADNENIAPGR